MGTHKHSTITLHQQCGECKHRTSGSGICPRPHAVNAVEASCDRFEEPSEICYRCGDPVPDLVPVDMKRQPPHGVEVHVPLWHGVADFATHIKRWTPEGSTVLKLCSPCSRSLKRWIRGNDA